MQMLEPGLVLHNRYRVVSRLGEGGMGAVYRAWDTELNVPCALKEMRPPLQAEAVTLSKLGQQFQTEARTLATLHHQNLPRVTGYFIAEGKHYLVMDFIQGDSLDQVVEREGAIDEARALAWADQVLDALVYIHSRNVIHRDISPQNLILTPEGRVVLVDFGLVKAWDPGDPATRTAVRGMGKPEYSPPEQYNLTGQHTDPRSDVYALGATLYHLLTGQSPPSVTDRMANPDNFVRPRVLQGQISDRVEAIVLKAMEMSLKDRFQSADAMRQALQERTQAESPKPQRSFRRLYVALPLAGIALVAACILIVVLSQGQATPEPTVTPTWTSTPAPPTPSPSTPPTATLTPSRPAPSATATPTETPTGTATGTPIPSSTVTDTSSSTPTPNQVTNTPLPPVVPVLLEPAGGATLGTDITFSWQGTLRSGQFFSVYLNHPGEGWTVTSEALTGNSWRVSLPADRFGQWQWQVRVMQGGTVLRQSQSSQFWLDPFPNKSTPVPPTSAPDDSGTPTDEPAPTETSYPISTVANSVDPFGAMLLVVALSIGYVVPVALKRQRILVWPFSSGNKAMFKKR